MDNVILSEDYEEKIARIVEGGKDGFHVIADYDRTLTRAFIDGQMVPTSFSQIRKSEFLGKEYSDKTTALFDHYHPIEIDPNIPIEEKSALMDKWWREHFEVLIEAGITRSDLKKITEGRQFYFREGVKEMLALLHEGGVPLVIMSAGLGDIISGCLAAQGMLYDNIHIISNRFEFDANGRITSVKEPIIHVFNKHEVVVDGLPVYGQIKDRRNVMLLGDGLGDIGMIEGFDYENLVKIGFLNVNVKESLEKHRQSYDAVLLNDADVNFVNEALERIIR